MSGTLMPRPQQLHAGDLMEYITTLATAELKNEGEREATAEEMAALRRWTAPQDNAVLDYDAQGVLSVTVRVHPSEIAGQEDLVWVISDKVASVFMALH